MEILDKNKAMRGLFRRYGGYLSEYEGISVPRLEAMINEGRAVILGNPSHKNVTPVIIGQPARIKVNANIGTSSFVCSFEDEFLKLKTAEKAGADTFMDLSTAGDLDKIRMEMINRSRLPIGTVPLYAVAEGYIDEGRLPEDIDMNEVFEEIEKQAEEGVDFMTVHTGIDMAAAAAAQKGRALGIVSRGGSMIARWMAKNGKENPLLTGFDRILEIALKHNVTLSLGDGLRPGAIQDAGDAAQWAEAAILGDQVSQARQAGVGCMVEGPGHVPLSEVASQMKTMKRLVLGAPLYILGPLTIDVAVGHDHIAGAIGAAAAGIAGADFFCYLTPAEHLTLPEAKDVKEGVIASRIAAYTADTALGRPYAVKAQNDMANARKKLDWEAMKACALDPDTVEERKPLKGGGECAMCGEFCSIKLGNIK